MRPPNRGRSSACRPCSRSDRVIRQTATQLAALLARGEVASRRLCEQFLDAVRRHDPRLKAFLHVDEAEVLRQADEIDRRRGAGEPLGPLAGLPVALKDNLCTLGTPT